MTTTAQSHGVSHPLNPAKPRKYGNKKVVGMDGYTFDSKAEASRWEQLRLMEKGGYITDLKRQVAFVLCPAVRMGPAKRMKPAIKLTVDFQYRDKDDTLILEDTKGVVTDVFRLKQHLLKDRYGMEVRLVR